MSARHSGDSDRCWRNARGCECVGRRLGCAAIAARCPRESNSESGHGTRERLPAIGKAAQEYYLRHFTLERMAEQYMEVYGHGAANCTRFDPAGDEQVEALMDDGSRRARDGCKLFPVTFQAWERPEPIMLLAAGGQACGIPTGKPLRKADDGEQQRASGSTPSVLSAAGWLPIARHA